MAARTKKAASKKGTTTTIAALEKEMQRITDVLNELNIEKAEIDTEEAALEGKKNKKATAVIEKKMEAWSERVRTLQQDASVFSKALKEFKGKKITKVAKKKASKKK